ncbi:SET [Glarea lozoyensis ATCC 20868]|uniref:SET n=1 Tax=Glarea lozoyensis (strain ATCC 20868 / MF5171) TaxID=1116229 RepID=S3DWS3_GLAL2|nr:SET [Glarea lozoyensis ATCC 20868]EPE36391.1 SET [Glarea lozoyensis ATCC 20868]
MSLNHTKRIKDPLLGHGLVSTEALEPGDRIIQIKDPYLIVVEKDALDRVCSYCLAENDISALKRCTGCKIVRYCSSTCQKSDWKLIHKSECPVLGKLPGLPPTPVRALYQALVRYSKSGDLDERSKGLESHIDELKKDQRRWEDMFLQARAAVEFSKSPPAKMEMCTRLLCIVSQGHQIIRDYLMMYKMATNAFRATLPDDTPIGLCYEPTLALANHSCTPNAYIMFDGRSISLIALDSIEQDEQLFISYVDFTQSRDLRRAELRQRYFFQCECKKCTDDLNPYQILIQTPVAPSPKFDLFVDRKSLVDHARSRTTTLTHLDTSTLTQSSQKVYTILDQTRSTASPQAKLNLLKQGLHFLSQFHTNALHALPPYPTLLDEVYLLYIDTSYLPAALILLLFTFLNCDVYNWPQPHHPVRVTRLFTIARLLKYAASLQLEDLTSSLPTVPSEVLQSVDFIDAVHVVLVLVDDLGRKSHGADSRFMVQVAEELKEVEEVQRLRGDSGRAIRGWQSGNSNESMKVVESVLSGLRLLAGYAVNVVKSLEV